MQGRVSFDVNPTSRQLLENLIEQDLLDNLVRAGARFHQAGCGGCIGMGQSPPTGPISLRTVPRNFPGRSGTAEDQVSVQPGNGTASAITGVITDPRTLGMAYPRLKGADTPALNTDMLMVPPASDEAAELEKGPNIKPLPTWAAARPPRRSGAAERGGQSFDRRNHAGRFESASLPKQHSGNQHVHFQPDRPNLLRAGHGITRAGILVVAGDNYGQGSSREHAAMAPRYLGLRMVLAKSFARIHWQNLANFGVLPLVFENPEDYERIQQGDEVQIDQIRDKLQQAKRFDVRNQTRSETYPAAHTLSERQVEMILEGSLINEVRRRLQTDR